MNTTPPRSVKPCICAFWLTVVILGCSGLATFGQCSPGPPSGGGINRCYADGFVYVDSSGNAGGYTWFWSYRSFSQIQDGFLVFHSLSNLDSHTVQVLTDAYDTRTLLLPPPPYTGAFDSPGPLIPDAPASRSTNLVTLPTLFIQPTDTNAVVISWPSSAGEWVLQQNFDPSSPNWANTQATPSDDGTNKSITVSPPVGNMFYRLRSRLY